MTKKAIAITGGIGSGKSRAASWLAKHCYLQYINSDVLVHALLEVGADGWHELRTALDASYFNDNGLLDKRKLRLAIFDDQLLRSRVEQLLHPLVLKYLDQQLEKEPKELEKQGYLVEVPLLYEVNWQGHFNFVIVVYADNETCVDRLVVRDNLSEDQALAAISAQMPLKEKALLADYVIDNNDTWGQTVRQLQCLKKMIDDGNFIKKLDSRW